MEPARATVQEREMESATVIKDTQEKIAKRVLMASMKRSGMKPNCCAHFAMSLAMEAAEDLEPRVVRSVPMDG